MRTVKTDQTRRMPWSVSSLFHSHFVGLSCGGSYLGSFKESCFGLCVILWYYTYTFFSQNQWNKALPYTDSRRRWIFFFFFNFSRILKKTKVFFFLIRKLRFWGQSLAWKTWISMKIFQMRPKNKICFVSPFATDPKEWFGNLKKIFYSL